MNTQVRDIGMVIMAICIIFVAVMAFPRIDNALKSKAVSDCAKSAVNTAFEGGFNGAIYKICVEDAGYKTQIK